MIFQKIKYRHVLTGTLWTVCGRSVDDNGKVIIILQSTEGTVSGKAKCSLQTFLSNEFEVEK